MVREQNALPGGCEGELEGLLANKPPMRLTVRRLAARPDLASASVTTANGSTVSVELLRRGRRWLLSFAGRGGDPMPALSG